MMIASNRIVAAAAAVAVLAAAWAAGPFAPATAQDVPAQATPAASPAPGFEDARLADLQTRVADLTTRVADLGGAEDPALAGRLGGRREGFDALFGFPVAYLGPGQVQYDVPGIGRVSVTFVDGIAERIAAVAPRPADLPLAQADPSDWSAQQARDVVAAFAPADAPLPADAVLGASPVSATSAALGAATNPADPLACGPVGGRSFAVTAEGADPDQVAAVALALGPQQAALAPAQPEAGGRANRGASAVANTSLGGPVSVNGLRLQAEQVQDRAVGARPTAEGQTLFAVDLVVENDTRRPVRFAPTDFVLVDAQGRELTAVCGGVDPAFPFDEIGRRETAEGWVSFQVPADFVPARMVVLASNARVGFELN